MELWQLAADNPLDEDLFTDVLPRLLRIQCEKRCDMIRTHRRR